MGAVRRHGGESPSRTMCVAMGAQKRMRVEVGLLVVSGEIPQPQLGLAQNRRGMLAPVSPAMAMSS